MGKQYGTVNAENVVKKSLVAFLLVVCCFQGSALSVKVEKLYPNQALISWSVVDGTAHYDVYVDNIPVVRLGGKSLSCVVGGNTDPLLSNHAYKIIVAARDGSDKNLDAAQISITTGSWSGSYVWDNPTDNNNKGRCIHLRYVIDDVSGGQMIIKSELPELGLQVVSPMPVSDVWTGYDDSSAAVYRANGLMFNTTNTKPSKFKVSAVEQDAKGIHIEVKTKAVGLTFTTDSYYQFIINDQGKKACVFWTTGSGLASTGIFKNPEKGTDGKFFLLEE